MGAHRCSISRCVDKGHAGTLLRETLRLGQYRLVDENTTLKARAQSRDRVRWLRENTSTELDQNIKKDECEYPIVDPPLASGTMV